MEVVIFTGLPGAGKSTYYTRKFFATHIRINLDMLKTRHREKLLFEACLAAKQAVVVDNTNPTAAERLKYIEAAKSAGFTVVGYYFVPDAVGAIERNAGRNGKARVPEAAIRHTLSKLEPQSADEGFDRLYEVRLRKSGAECWEYDIIEK
jgi:predicted kinase